MSIYHTGYTILLISYAGSLKVIYNLSDARNLHPHNAGPCTVESPNINVVQGVAIIISGSMVLVNLLVDILYAYLDPRIHYA